MTLPVTVTGLNTGYPIIGPFQSLGTKINTTSLGASDFAFGHSAASSLYQRGQTFTTSQAFDLVSITAVLRKTGSPTDNVLLDIYATSGGIPTGNSLGQASLNSSQLTNLALSKTFTFASPISLSATTMYAAVFSRSGSLDTSNYFLLSGAGTNVYAGGTALDNNGSGTWSTITDADVSLTVRAAPAIYIFGRDATTATTLQALKSIDPSGSGFASVATKTGFTTAILNIGGPDFQSIWDKGWDLFTLIVADGAAGSRVYKYVVFDSLTETFSTPVTIQSPGNTAGAAGGDQFGCSLVYTAGHLIAFYSSTRIKSQGTYYARVSESHSINDGANWLTPQAVDPGGSFSYNEPNVVVGFNGAVHLNFQRTDGQFNQRTLNSNLTLETASTPITAANYPCRVSYNASDTFIVLNQGGGVVYYTSATTPTLNETNIVGGSGVLYVDNGDSYKLWWLYRASLDGLLYARYSTDNGATWSSATLVVGTGTLTPILASGGIIYQRGSNVFAPYLYLDGTDLKYGEFVVRTTVTQWQGSALLAGAGALACDATVLAGPQQGAAKFEGAGLLKADAINPNRFVVCESGIYDFTFGSTAQVAAAQSFICPTGTLLTSVEVRLKEYGNPTDSVVAYVYNADANGLPTAGISAASSSCQPTSAYANYTLTFSPPVPLVKGNRYAIGLSRTSASDDLNNYHWLTDNSNVYADGLASYWYGSSWIGGGNQDLWLALSLSQLTASAKFQGAGRLRAHSHFPTDFVISDSCTYNGLFGYAASEKWAENFVAPRSGVFNYVEAWVAVGLGNPSDNVFVELFSVDASHHPTGTAIATSEDVSRSLLGSQPKPITFLFSTPPDLTIGAEYAVVIARDGALDGSNYYNIYRSLTDEYASGVEQAYASGAWTSYSQDLAITLNIGSIKAAALLAGAGNLQVDATITHYVADGSALLVGAGLFKSDATITHYVADGAAALAGAGLFKSDATVLHYVADGAARFSGAGEFKSDAVLTHYVADGAALLAGAGQLRADATVTHYIADGAALFAGAGAFLADATLAAQTWQGAAAFVGAGELKADATLVHYIADGAAAFSGAGLLKADATLVHYAADGSALLAGSGLLKADATITHYVADAAALLAGAGLFKSDATITHYVADAAALFAGAGSLQADAVRATVTWDGAARFSGVGSLTADAQVKGTWTGEARFVGAGSLAVSATLIEAGAALLAGAGQLRVAATLALKGETAFSGAGSFKAAATHTPEGAALLAGAGALAVNASHTPEGAALFAGAGSLKAAAQIAGESAGAVFAGAGSLAADATVLHATWAGAAAFAGAGSFAADADVAHVTLAAAARFSGAGLLAAATIQEAQAGAILQGEGGLAVDSIVATPRPSAWLQGQGALSVSAILIERAGAIFTGRGDLDVRPDAFLRAAAALRGLGALHVSTEKVHQWRVTRQRFEGEGKLSCHAQVITHGAAKLRAVGHLAAKTNAIRLGRARFAGLGRLRASTRLTERLEGAAHLRGSGHMHASARLAPQHHGAAHLHGVGYFTARGFVLSPLHAAAKFQGRGHLDADADLLIPAAAALRGRGDLDARALLHLTAAAAFAGAGRFAANARVATQMDIAAAFAGAGSLACDAVIWRPPATASFNGRHAAASFVGRHTAASFRGGHATGSLS